MAEGFRITRYIGGNSVEEVAYIESGTPPYAGAMDGQGRQLFFGSTTQVPDSSGCVYSLGLQKSGLSNGVFNVFRTSSSSGRVTALNLADNNSLAFEFPVVGWGQGGPGIGGLDIEGSDYSVAPSIWWSQMYKIGQPFKIKKIRIPLAQSVATNMTVAIKIYTDDGNGTTYTLTPINNTNDNGKFNIVRRAGQNGEVLNGQHNFWIELKWTGSALCTVGLPISIEYELIND